MKKSSADFHEAAALHKQGRPAEAIPIYEAVLRREPRNVNAANLLGVALMQAGKPEEAAAAIQKGLRANPNQPSAHYNLGTILQRLDRQEEAVHHYQKAISLNPDDPLSRNNLGVALKALGRLEESGEAYRHAIGLKPDFFQAHVNLATVFSGLEQHDKAIASAKHALIINPNLAEAYLIIGNALHAQDKSFEGLDAIDRAIKLQPERPEGYLCAGNIMLAIHFEDRAIPHFQEALRFGAKSVSAFFKLALCLHMAKAHDEASVIAEKGFRENSQNAEDEAAIALYLQRANRDKEALKHFKKALDWDPNFLTARLGYASSLSALQRNVEALEQFEVLQTRHPNHKKGLFNQSLTELSLGRFDEGWRLYETRFSEEVGLAVPRYFPFPSWKGGKVGALLIWGEQGLGDHILYASILGDLLDSTENVMLEVEPRLVDLMKRSFPKVDIVSKVRDKKNIKADAHLPMGSLGKFFRRDWQDFPRLPYLIPNNEHARRLREKLAEEDKIVVGISWTSANPKFGDHKTVKLQDLVSVLTNPTLKFVNLQYGDTKSEVSAFKAKSGVEINSVDEIDNTQDIDGLAALIEACDAVLTVSNTTAHIAGALGKPVWIMIPHAQGRLWYWFQNRRDSPWYPGARLIRQQLGQSWADVVASLAPEISEFAQNLKAGR